MTCFRTNTARESSQQHTKLLKKEQPKKLGKERLRDKQLTARTDAATSNNFFYMYLPLKQHSSIQIRQQSGNNAVSVSIGSLDPIRFADAIRSQHRNTSSHHLFTDTTQKVDNWQNWLPISTTSHWLHNAAVENTCWFCRLRTVRSTICWRRVLWQWKHTALMWP